MALGKSAVADAAESLLLVVLYAVVFLLPLIFPPAPCLSLIPVMAGVVLVPAARSFVFPGRAAAPLLVAAILAGLLFTGVYLAAIDSAMRGSHGAVWPQPEMMRSILVFSLSPYGAFGAACLALVAYACHFLGFKVRLLFREKVTRLIG